MNPLKQLEQFGQSPWLDFIQRSFTGNGLQTLVDRDGLKGITSNPSIFQKAMGEGTDYDAGFKALAGRGDYDAQAVYEALAIEDIQQAADLMRPVYEATGHVDGYVSLEVSPYLALRTDETVAEARRLWAAVGRPNLMVKVPGTTAGAPAIRTLIGEGLNINVTLLFAQSAYEAVAEAFIAGLEDRLAAGHPIAGISSVASFFVSRIDAVMDKAIDARVVAGETASGALRGKIAIANAKMAYQTYLELVASPRWQRLRQHGALPQRLLWASTGVKDKAYPDTLYVDQLIGPDTVNTIPPATMDAFRDHGTAAATLAHGVDDARRVLADAEAHGLDLAGATARLVEDGVRLFAEAADGLLGSVATKRAAMLGDTLVTVELSGLKDETEAVRKEWASKGHVRDMWAHDAAVWTGTDEAQWLGWLHAVDNADLPSLQAFQDHVRAGNYRTAVLLGMGGSSLGPEVLAQTLGWAPGFPQLLILDSTDPAQIATLTAQLDLQHTLVIVSSKSGSTLEPNIFKDYFWDQMTKVHGEDAKKHFVAITDPGSKLQGVAEHDGFAHVFAGDPTIGGRYSVLSNFGLVPAAAIGLDLRAFLDSTALMVCSCSAGTPPNANPGVQLGALLGVAAKHGIDKLTIIASPGLADAGAWLEQLIAESTGKQGHGIIPVDGEALGGPDVYGTDRIFAYLRLVTEPEQDAGVAALAGAHPVATMTLHSTMQLGQLFFAWEFATAVAGSVIGIDPFNQPDVEASKIETRKLTDAVAATGKLPDETPFLTEDGISLFADPANIDALPDTGLDAVIRAHLARAGAGDYVALLAYIERNPAHIAVLETLRNAIRGHRHVATCVGFGPRFLHSTGQAYKGGPNSGVFLQITTSDPADLPVPGATYTFGTVKAAQARGDLAVLEERGRRALRVHLSSPDALHRLADAITRSFT